MHLVLKPITIRTALVAALAMIAAFLVSGAAPARALPLSTAANASEDSLYTPLSPLRALDTRRDLGASGPVAAGQTITLTVAGNGVPSTGVSAVAINLTATAPQRTGYLVAYPDATPAPGSSNLNFLAGQTVANTAIVAVGDDGKIAITNRSSGTVQVVGDISGYFTGYPSTSYLAGAYVPVTPWRVLDTRSSIGAPGPIPAGATITLVVAGGGVPTANVGSVAMNLTVVNPQDAGYVTAYPDLTAPPTSSSVNFTAGQTVANFGVITVGSDGVVKVTNHSKGAVQLVGDISGYAWVGPSTTNGAFTSLTPARVLDTRTGTGATGPIAPNGSITVSLSSVGGLPLHNVGAAALNLTVTAPTRPGYIAGLSRGDGEPTSSAVNFVAGQTVANLDFARVPASGQVTFVNHSAGPVQLIADVSGYFAQSYWSSVNVGVSGPGSVSGSPGGISCPGVCSATLLNATQVTLTASPAPGANFNGWVSGCSGRGTCTVAAPGNASAQFTAEGGLAPAQVGTVGTNFFGKTAVCVTNLDIGRTATFHAEDQPPVGAYATDGTLSPAQTNCTTLDRGWVGYNVLVTNTSGNGSHIAACVLPSGETSCRG